ncbi:uncharacterized protein LOC135369124 [Ornithodoros turicata]|uniref:uncharacterized protein LOC135369124 n=1 Tax=Ornithodoros turicata TaxID=34597 RepID=UPI00313984BB
MPGIRCPRCDRRTLTLRCLFRHLRAQHGHESPIPFNWVCGLGNCMRTFPRYATYRKHVTRAHGSLLEEDGRRLSQELPARTAEEATSPDASREAAPSPDASRSEDLEHAQEGTEQVQEDDVRQLALLLLRWRAGRRVPESTVDEITSDIIAYIQGLVEHRPVGDLEERLTSLVTHDLQPLKTRRGREQYWKNTLPFIEPRTVTLGRNEGGKVDKFHYVPIRDVLKHVLDPSYLHEGQQASNAPDGYFSSIFDGAAFSEHRYFRGDNSKICIQLYSDEFEVCDPLGSKRGKHKLMAVYFSVLNLPQKSRSSLSSTHLALLVKDKHVGVYGLEKILAPLIEDISLLEREGIELEGEVFKGTVFVVTGDNLSQHRLGGFKCSFTHGRICRFCLALRHEIDTKHLETDFALRTPGGHQHHLSMLNAVVPTVSLYGVKEQCSLTFSGFDPTEHLPPDVMHNVHEGILPFAMKHILSSLISSGLFSLDDLNKEVVRFDYAPYDQKNKPEQLSREFVFSKGNMKGRASQVFCVFRHLPFYVGQRVPSDNPVWKLYTLLREVVDVIMSRVIPVPHIPYLQRLIHFFLIDFHSLFPSARVPCKFHYLVHYLSFIYKFGPLVNLWAMRFEAKHQYVKDIARKCRNFKNITLTLSTKHQFLQMYTFSQSNSQCELRTAGCKPCLSEHVPDVLLAYMNSQNIVCENIFAVNSATIDGIVLLRGSVLVLQASGDELPVFAQLCDIYAANRVLLGVAQKLDTVEFDAHFHMYTVSVTAQVTGKYHLVSALPNIVCEYDTTKNRSTENELELFNKTNGKSIVPSVKKELKVEDKVRVLLH